MTALPFVSQPALVALAIFWPIAAAVVVALFGWSGRHRDDVFRYDTPTGDRRRQEGT